MTSRVRGSQPLRATSEQASSRVLTPAEILVVAKAAGFGNNMVPSTPGNFKLPAIVVAAAIALAESGGNTTVYNGICCDGLWQINRNHKPADMPLSTWLNDMHDPVKNGRKAFELTSGGTVWNTDIFSTYGGQRYMANIVTVQKTVKDPDTIAAMKDALGSVQDLGIIGLAEAPFEVGVSLFGIAAEKFGQWLGASIVAMGKWFWNGPIVGFGQHSERAYKWYWQNIMSGPESQHGLAPLMTIAFWGLGYAVLFADPSDPVHLADSPRDTALAQSLTAGKSAMQRRALYKPKEVKSATDKKPKPHVSSAPIQQVGTARVARNRPVRSEVTNNDQKTSADKQAGATTTSNSTPTRQLQSVS